MPETATRTVSFPCEPIKVLTIKLEPKVCRHILIEHITIRAEEWAKRTGIDICLINEFMKDKSRDINRHSELCNSVSEMLLDSAEWPASFPQYICTTEDVSHNQNKKLRYCQENILLVAKKGNIIIASLGGNCANVITSYFPSELNVYDSEYDLYARSIKNLKNKYRNSEIHDTKNDLLRTILKCRYVSELHWLMLPRVHEYCGERK